MSISSYMSYVLVCDECREECGCNMTHLSEEEARKDHDDWMHENGKDYCPTCRFICSSCGRTVSYEYEEYVGELCPECAAEKSGR